MIVAGIMKKLRAAQTSIAGPSKSISWRMATSTGPSPIAFASLRWMLAFLVLAAALPARAAQDKPNIIFLLTDEMGYGDVGCYGGNFVPTPNIDRLAKEGTKFTQFYVASPVCSPSRTAFLTGMFPARWHITSYLQTRAGNRKC